MESVDVAIVGAGPVGLTLAGLLALRGVSVAVLEARTERSPHSRAIGLHPPALDVFKTLGLGDALLAEGVRIGGGQVFRDTRLLGRLALPEPTLSLPQARTEALLEARLATLAAGALRRGVALIGLEVQPEKVVLCCERGALLGAKLLVGCDGASSAVRRLAKIGRQGMVYPDRYLMGDFADNTELGTDAGLFFGPEGIVESFPLPGNQRRWVARLDGGPLEPSVESLAALVRARTGHRLPVETCSWISPFGVQGFVAETFFKNRVALAGDAAHVVSPIGGQGMNLGLLGAATLARAWSDAPGSLDTALRGHRRRSIQVQRRAAFNTGMGRPLPPWSLKWALIAAVLGAPPLSRRFARAFVMRDL
jgi:2-polyprenyl-6-methoxyphenol hydroxylase-like FAD-dependent oxidoreductase